MNAAGLWTEGPAEATLEADFDRVMGVNLKGLFFLSAAAIPRFTNSLAMAMRWRLLSGWDASSEASIARPKSRNEASPGGR